MDRRLNLNKTVLTITVLNTIQIAAALGFVVYRYFEGVGVKPYGTYLLVLIIAAVLLNSFLTIRDVRNLGHYNSEYDMLKTSLEQVENLNKTLRGQRHDFMNHLQVVYGLIEMNEYGDARDYIERVFHDIQKVSNILRTANPAVNALLQAKILFGEKRGIKTEMKITSRLTDLKIPSWEFCRVLGNIIDNSIYALQEREGERIIEIEIFEDLKNYGFKIKNNGPKIPEEVMDRIFQPGFTTKKERGDGMGLAIASEIINQYNGEISASSSDAKTVFEGWVPRK